MRLAPSSHRGLQLGLPRTPVSTRDSAGLERVSLVSLGTVRPEVTQSPRSQVLPWTRKGRESQVCARVLQGGSPVCPLPAPSQHLQQL